jgi:hypothetical protein
MAQDDSEVGDFLSRLRRLTFHVDPTIESSRSRALRDAGASLDSLPAVDAGTVPEWVRGRPADVYALALTVGLSQEKLKNLLRSRFGTSSWSRAARADPAAVVGWLDDEFGLLNALGAQRGRVYTFGDVLAVRGESRNVASSAGVAGRLIEDSVEEIVRDLGLSYEMRGRFTGRNGETAPADLAIPTMMDTLIAVACKGFDSTGSKLTAAVSEVTEMAGVRYAQQYVLVVVDGIGWRSRMGDFRRMHALARTRRIDGLYSLADLGRFRADLTEAARRHALLP